MRIVAVGEIVWDLLPAGPRLGGAPANVAAHAAQLGDRAAIVSRIGADRLGDRALAELGRRGVDVGAVARDSRRATGTVSVRVERGEPAFEIDGRAAWAADGWAAVARSASFDALLAGADAVCFGTLLQGGCERAVGRAVLERVVAASRPGAWRLLDVNLRPPFDGDEAIEAALGAANAVKLNEAEAARLAVVAGVTDVARWLIEVRGMKLVALTRGAKGSRLLTADGEQRLLAEVSADGRQGDPAADSVGAGDAFAAALLHHLVRGHPLARAHAAAARCGAFVASRAGATPPLPPALRDEIVG